MEIEEKVVLQLSSEEIMIILEWAKGFNLSLKNSIEKQTHHQTHPIAMLELDAAIRFISSFQQAMVTRRNVLDPDIALCLDETLRLCIENLHRLEAA